MAGTVEFDLGGNSDSDDYLEFLLLARWRIAQKKRRNAWVRPIFSMRKQQGEYHNLLQEMSISDPESHFRYLRMSKERFDSLLSMACTIAIW